MRSATRYPIVLAHGLMGFIHLVVGRLTVWTYFRGVSERLRSEGFDVHVTEVPKTAAVATRAQTLAEALDGLRLEKVNIIAHSMGGLDARWLISRLGFGRGGRVASLTTIATPHRGTSLARMATRSIARGRLGPLTLMEAFGMETGAFHDLTPEACRAFNDLTPDDPEVAYFSYAGNRAWYRISLPLQATYHMLRRREGPNDGLVAVSSARWGRYLGELDADHMCQIGWRLFRPKEGGFDHLAFFSDHCRLLAGMGF